MAGSSATDLPTKDATASDVEETVLTSLDESDSFSLDSSSSSSSDSLESRLTDLGECSNSCKNRKTSHQTRSPAQDDTPVEETGLWVFGYGSLCWHQGFEFEKSLTGFVEGFSRRFWQGNSTHRGTDKKPGRVATLVEESEGIVWGQAFQVKGEDALPYLNNRECELGGYLTTISTFYPRQTRTSGSGYIKPFPVVLYLATPSNKLWLGDSSLSEIANQIMDSTGGSGHNVEYLLRLADFVRDNIPEAVDEHLFTLEHLVRIRIKERKLCLKTLMGEKQVVKMEPQEVAGVAEQPAEADVRPGTFQFTSRVPSKKLRCLNI